MKSVDGQSIFEYPDTFAEVFFRLTPKRIGKFFIQIILAPEREITCSEYSFNRLICVQPKPVLTFGKGIGIETATISL